MFTYKTEAQGKQDTLNKTVLIVFLFSSQLIAPLCFFVIAHHETCNIRTSNVKFLLPHQVEKGTTF